MRNIYNTIRQLFNSNFFYFEAYFCKNITFIHQHRTANTLKFMLNTNYTNSLAKNKKLMRHLTTTYYEVQNTISKIIDDIGSNFLRK